MPFAKHCMQKIAIDPITLGLGGLATHVSANVISKLFKSTKTGLKAGAAAMASGIRRGLRKEELGHGVRQVANTLIGPEATVGHDLGHRLGGHLAGMSKAKQHKALKKIRSFVASAPELRDAPYGKSLIGGINRVIDNPEHGRLGRFASMAAGTKQSLGSRAASAALIGGTAVAEPSSILHMGFNKARHAIATSERGKNIMKNQFNKGIDGHVLHKGKEFAADMLLSPKALDSRRLGLAAHRLGQRYGVDARKATNVIADAVKSHEPGNRYSVNINAVANHIAANKEQVKNIGNQMKDMSDKYKPQIDMNQFMDYIASKAKGARR